MSILAPGAPPPSETAIAEALGSISSPALLGYVFELASERFGGRLSGTADYRAAAEWAAAQFAQGGLRPGGDGGGFLQAFPNPYTQVLRGGELTLLEPPGTGAPAKSYAYGTEYFPGGTSGSGKITAEVVYAGYGITAPDLGYDDYAGVDVRGRIVLLEQEVPVASEFQPGFDPAAFPPWRPHSFHQDKLENALRHGARGMLYHCGPIAMPNNSHRDGFIYSAVGGAVIEDLFAGTGRVHADVLAGIRAGLRPDSFATGRLVTMENVTAHHPEGIGFNVIGLIPGTDAGPRRDALLVGAHLDHCGRSWELLPGANDDASGVAVVLGLAAALPQIAARHRRTVILALFGGEEQGFLGSGHYCEHPVVPLADTAAMINLDLVGVGERIFAYGGKNSPALWAFMEKANAAHIHRPLATIGVANLGRPRLDGALFAARGVPTLSFALTGPDGNSPGSHNASDRPEAITPEPMADLARLLCAALADMAGRETLDFRGRISEKEPPCPDR